MGRATRRRPGLRMVRTREVVFPTPNFETKPRNVYAPAWVELAVEAPQLWFSWWEELRQKVTTGL